MAETEARALTLRETFGLTPLGPALADARRSLLGGPHAARTRFDLSSVRIFKPWIGLPTWLGHRRPDRRVPVYNYVNRVAAPRDEGYSVRVTYARDFRGGRHTYDGHLGTDFAVPVGTVVVAAAPGVVLRVGNDWASGGLKVAIDHGDGLLTTSNHLARALVRAGDRVRRAEPVGLSGASGLEFVLLFPWVSPHLHFNVWLDGTPVDPFSAGPDEPCLWRGGNDPRPATAPSPEEPSPPGGFDDAGVAAAIAACRDPRLAARIRALPTVAARACEVTLLRNYRPASFAAFPPVYAAVHARAPRLDLPFRAADFDGIAHAPQA
jgi:murein DD-endopeptidase